MFSFIWLYRCEHSMSIFSPFSFIKKAEFLHGYTKYDLIDWGHYFWSNEPVFPQTDTHPPFPFSPYTRQERIS